MALLCSHSELPLRVRSTKSCTPQGPREIIKIINPGFVLSFGAKLTLRIAFAGSRSVPLNAATLATPATVWLPAVSRHMAEAKAAVTSFNLLPAEPAGDPPDLNVGLLE